MPKLRDHKPPGPHHLKYAQLTAWPLLNPKADFFSRHEDHDHAIIGSPIPKLVVPLPPANEYSVYAWEVVPLYDYAASQAPHPIDAGPACWKKSQANFAQQYSTKYINRSLAGANAFAVQHPRGAAVVDPCCNTLQKMYYWHVAALPTIVPLPKA